jgi:sugar lactone lactonase YvrE
LGYRRNNPHLDLSRRRQAMPRARTQSVPQVSDALTPRIDDVLPAAALPGGDVELTGANLGPGTSSNGFVPPEVLIGGETAHLLLSRPSRLIFRVPDPATTGLVEVRTQTGATHSVPLRVARELSSGLHPVTSPAVSRSGMIYATISGARGKSTPVSVVRISPDGRGTPFVTGILNATGLAFNPEGDLFVTSRAEGVVYRVDAAGEFTIYAEGMGIATGAAFDAEGNLYVGDRSGTIFKINPQQQIFVHATLEPSVSAYHLAVNAAGTLYVTGPTLGSNDAIYEIGPHGDSREWYRGLGRPQGLAVAADGSVYVAACLHGRRGIVQVTDKGDARLVLAGSNLIGLAFSPLGTAVLATHQAVYDVDLGVEGQF